MSTVDVDLALVRRFYTVCTRYDTRPSVARRNTLPMLIRYLTSNDREVRQCAVASLCLLAQHPQSAALLAGNETLAQSIAQLLSSTQLDDPELHEAALRLQRLLYPRRSMSADNDSDEDVVDDDDDATLPASDEDAPCDDGSSRHEHRTPRQQRQQQQQHLAGSGDDVTVEYDDEDSDDDGPTTTPTATALLQQQHKQEHAHHARRGDKASDAAAALHADKDDERSDTQGQVPPSRQQPRSRRPQLYDTPHKTRRQQQQQQPASASSSFLLASDSDGRAYDDRNSQQQQQRRRRQQQQQQQHQRRQGASRLPAPPRLVTLDVPAVNARADLTDVERVLQSTRGVISYTMLASTHQLKVFVSPQMDVAVLQEALQAAGYASLVVSVERRVLAGEEAYMTATAASSSWQQQSSSMRGGYGRNNNNNSSSGSYYDAQPSRPTYGQKARTFASSLMTALSVYGGGGGGSGSDSAGHSRSAYGGQSLAERMQRQQQADEAPRNATAERIAKVLARWW